MKLKRAAALLLMLSLSVQTVAGTAFAAELPEEVVETESQSAEETLKAIQETIQETAEESVSEETRESISEETEELHISDTEDSAENVEEDAAAEAEKETDIETSLGQVSDETSAESEESVSAEESDIAEQTAIVEEGTITETEAVSILAEETAEETGMELYAMGSVVSSGVCGDNLTWTLDSDGVLTISGTGDMYGWEYSGYDDSPWFCNKNVVRIVIEDGVTSIGECAFRLTGVKEVSIPDSVTHIDNMALADCYDLETITIPDSVTEIVGFAFQGSGLVSVKLSENISVISVGMFADCDKLETVTIPDSVYRIDASAFMRCGNLKDIFIPDRVTSIDSTAFYNCSSDLTIHGYYGSAAETFASNNGLTFIGTEKVSSSTSGVCGVDLTWTLDSAGVLTISGTGRMYDCNHSYKSYTPWYENRNAIYSVVIEEGVTTVGRDAFYECANLRNVTIADSVTSIGNSAFSSCYRLNQVSLGNDVTYIGDFAFSLCFDLADIMIPDSVTYIGIMAFWAAGLNTVRIPSGVTNIGYRAFSACSDLMEIQVDDGNKYYESLDGSLVCTDSRELICYPGGKTDTSYTIPSDVAGIGEGAFVFCYNLESVTIPSSVTYIGEEAFEYCDGLTSVAISSGVIDIAERAFYSCENLKSVIIPASVTSIGRQAFDYCSEDLVIYGYAGSAAETYANENGITFVRIENVELIRAFASRCYSEVLGREAGESELDYWQNELVTGNQTAAQVAAFFVFSDEFKAKNTDNSQFLDRLYSTFFGRTADEGGKAYWINYLENGATRNWVTANFVNSPEFEAICADYGMERGTIGLTDYADQNVDLTMYVYRCYTKILGRAAEEDGLEWWCERIYTGLNQATDVARAFVLSEEFTAKNLSDGEYVEVLYEAFMGREADDAGKAYWIGLLQSGWSREDVLNVFAGCQEFQDILAGFGL